jgi:hypothetical protein
MWIVTGAGGASPESCPAPQGRAADREKPEEDDDEGRRPAAVERELGDPSD